MIKEFKKQRGVRGKEGWKGRREGGREGGKVGEKKRKRRNPSHAVYRNSCHSGSKPGPHKQHPVANNSTANTGYT